MRLTAEFWVQAYLTRLRQFDIPAFVVAHGDDKAGTILVKLNTLDGNATVYQRVFDILNDTRKWDILTHGKEIDVDAAIARQREFDRDIWIVEVEDSHGRHLLDDEGLSD